MKKIFKSLKSAAWTLSIVLATTALTIYCVIEFYKMWNLSLTIALVVVIAAAALWADKRQHQKK